MAGVMGGARTATLNEVQEHFSSEGSGNLYLGRFYEPERPHASVELRYAGDRHLLVLGPTGSGKTKRFLVPALTLGLENESVVVIDPKGELAAMTAEHRRKLGHEVIILNPFDVLGLGSAGFDPLRALDPESETFYDDAAALGEALIKVEGTEPHWSESAQGLIVGLLMWEKFRHRDGASLGNVRRTLTEPDQSETTRTELGRRVERQVRGLRATATLMTELGGFEIASLASRFTQASDELRSIQSTADTQTRWLLSPKIRADLEKDGIDFRRLKETKTTVYVVLPAERLRTHAVWLRLVIVSALRALYRPGSLRTVLLIDEMAALGHLGPLEDAFGLVRGYGIQIAAILQDLPQLQSLYKERWETFIANAGVVMGFAPNDLTTAEWMSKRSGQTTVTAWGYSENRSASNGPRSTSSAGSGENSTQIARPYFLPHELIGLGEGMGVAWLAGLAETVRLFEPYYLKIAKCRDRTTPSPYDEAADHSRNP